MNINSETSGWRVSVKAVAIIEMVSSVIILVHSLIMAYTLIVLIFPKRPTDLYDKIYLAAVILSILISLTRVWLSFKLFFAASLGTKLKKAFRDAQLWLGFAIIVTTLNVIGCFVQPGLLRIVDVIVLAIFCAVVHEFVQDLKQLVDRDWGQSNVNTVSATVP